METLKVYQYFRNYENKQITKAIVYLKGTIISSDCNGTNFEAENGSTYFIFNQLPYFNNEKDRQYFFNNKVFVKCNL